MELKRSSVTRSEMGSASRNRVLDRVKTGSIRWCETLPANRSLLPTQHFRQIPEFDRVHSFAVRPTIRGTSGLSASLSRFKRDRHHRTHVKGARFDRRSGPFAHSQSLHRHR